MRVIACAVMVCALALTAQAVRAYEKISLDDVPKDVLDAVKAKYAGAKLTAAEKEKFAGKMVYEISIVTKKGNKLDVLVSPEGKIVATEKLVTVKDLPKPVADALNDKFAGAKIGKIERVRVGAKRTYVARLTTTDGKRLRVEFDLTGKVLSERELKKKAKKEE
jgi:hypothetical protein